MSKMINSSPRFGDCRYAGVVSGLALEPEGFLGTVFGTTVEGTTTENYILLVRIDAEARTAADLGGGDLRYLSNARTCLALPWLDNLLRSEGLGETSEFFGSVASNSKVAKVVLPVFFGQADACLVTRMGFQMMAELNPQVGRELRVLATSPDVMPAVFVFRKNYDSQVRDDVLTGLRELHESAAGRQVLTVFQSERLVELPLSSMDFARRILVGHCDPASDGPGLGAVTTKTDDESTARSGLR